jgi:hypothetical protein
MAAAGPATPSAGTSNGSCSCTRLGQPAYQLATAGPYQAKVGLNLPTPAQSVCLPSNGLKDTLAHAWHTEDAGRASCALVVVRFTELISPKVRCLGPVHALGVGCIKLKREPNPPKPYQLTPCTNCRTKCIQCSTPQTVDTPVCKNAKKVQLLLAFMPDGPLCAACCHVTMDIHAQLGPVRSQNSADKTVLPLGQ